MKKHLIIIGTLLLLTGAGMAQTNSESNVDTVILASTSNYPDAMISSPVSEKLGYPVLLTEEGQLSSSAETSLQEMDPETVVMVGGPSVLSEQVESTAAGYANVTRLWAATQIGTSTEVADYFWPEGTEEAVIVQYPQDEEGYHTLMAKAKENADESPILISKEGTLSASVITAVEDLGVEEAEVYSTNAVNVTEDLEGSGVTDVELNTGEREELEEELESRSSSQNSEELVIVAAGNFRDTISIPNNPNSAAHIVSGEDQIQGAVTRVEESDQERVIKVVGNPDLAQTIADRIENETEREVDMVSGSPEEVSANQAREQRSEWQQIQEQRSSNWRNMADQNMMEKANRTIERAEKAVNENSSEEAREKLQDARDAFEDGEYFEARRMATEARSEARVMAFGKLNSEEVMEQVQEDREDFAEAEREIRETNQEMAEELQEAESAEERREIVREFREERMDVIRDIREEMQENEEDERRDRQERDRPNQTSSRLRMRLDGNKLDIDATLVGSSGGYNVDRSLTVENGAITGDITFMSPSGPATSVMTEYETSIERNLEDGDYSVDLELRSDGDVREQISDSITVPGEVEIERETNGMEAGDNTVELGEDEEDEDENESEDGEDEDQ